jgi:hypothetical protein
MFEIKWDITIPFSPIVCPFFISSFPTVEGLTAASEDCKVKTIFIRLLKASPLHKSHHNISGTNHTFKCELTSFMVQSRLEGVGYHPAEFPVKKLRKVAISFSFFTYCFSTNE